MHCHTCYMYFHPFLYVFLHLIQHTFIHILHAVFNVLHAYLCIYLHTFAYQIACRHVWRLTQIRALRRLFHICFLLHTIVAHFRNERKRRHMSVMPSPARSSVMPSPARSSTSLGFDSAFQRHPGAD